MVTGLRLFTGCGSHRGMRFRGLFRTGLKFGSSPSSRCRGCLIGASRLHLCSGLNVRTTGG